MDQNQKTPLFLAGKEREWQSGRKMLELCYGEAVRPKKEGSETVCVPESHTLLSEYSVAKWHIDLRSRLRPWGLNHTGERRQKEAFVE